MASEFVQYRNKIMARYGHIPHGILRILRKDPNWKVTEWLEQIVVTPTVWARQHATRTEWTSRRGTVAQPGRAKVVYDADVCVAEAGEYEVRMDEERRVVPKGIFEAVFERHREEST